MSRKLIEVHDIKKVFSGVAVLEGIDFDLEEGEVHALMGENGAGKSTLSKIISGIYQADGGTMLVEGERRSFANTREAVRHGVSIVTQEFSLLPDFSVAENIFLTDDRYYRSGFLSDRRAMAEKTRELLALFGMERDIDPYEKVEDLSVAQMQVIEILKAVSTNARTIILDEPTASLSTKEIDQLFEIVRKLKKEGVGFIIVSHKINEIYEISDRITVLRDGRLILNGAATKELKQSDLIKAMVGREVNNLYGDRSDHLDKDWSREEVVLEVRDMVDENRYLKHISFQVHKGEIVGFSGLVGAGRSELVRCVFGADRRTEGKVYLHGKEIPADRIRASVAERIGFVSEDRKRDGLLQEMSVIKNIGLAKLAASKRALIDWKKDAEDCAEMIRRMRIKTADVDMPIKGLSGGNQQKVLLAKWILLAPEVLIVDEPTRGVDIGAKADIYAILKELAAQGMAIVVVSSEIPEILGICDTIYVMREGKVTGVLNAAEAEEEKIGYFSTVG
ncbi:MAG: sugar ABC transporter ATP-binding protein [Eubacteriales bacterium]|nr:sugar ABC transporter ATP-binding protein [Eubacteriales bacterium]